ncbi:MAG: bifunctional DNA primase/polymerase [Deltaproteobacteria bacterium]|nr:bifunctional DNA primase/polymerase [Deltaproteobacteria bacterium]
MSRAALGAAARQFSMDLGVPVFPLRPGGKEPATTHGFYEASSDPARIRRWWKLDAFNIGMPTGRMSGVVVVDVDIDKGGSLDSLGAFAPTLSASTGNGLHLYFAAEGRELRSRVGILPGVDVRADGGYVVVPPSVHPSGKRYAWIDRVALSPLPAALFALLSKSSESASSPPHAAPVEADVRLARARAYIGAMPGAVSGKRGHDTTFRVALALVRGFGLAVEEAWPIFHEYNARCVPPWSERELGHKLIEADKARLPLGYLL